MKRTYKLFIFLCTICLTGCFHLGPENVEITAEYLINENWDGGWINPFVIEKAKVKKDSTIDPFSDLSQGEIVNKLEEDSSFRWLGSPGMMKNREELNKTKKVYFTKDNGFLWQNEVSKSETNILGVLEKNTWYKFSGLVFSGYFIYVYVDSTNQTHSFDVNQSNL